MKFMPNRDLDIVTDALNFSTPDLHILGGCDLYTTKAAGTDKKLYKNIEHGLEEQHKANVQFSRSLSPPQAQRLAPSLNLSKSSPFGNMGVLSARRTYAYLIATLNASHPDYDFSHTLRPTDFKRERSLRAVMNNIDSTLFNLRPRPQNSYLMVPGIMPGSACPPPGQSFWGPSMWRLIDQQMSLKECAIYRYAPEDFDPFEDDDEGAIWSVNYFFFNKARKRVCYLYLRGVSVLSHLSKDSLMTPVKMKRFADDEGSDADGWLTPDLGARKRAKYWLGDRGDGVVEVADPDPESDLHPDTDISMASPTMIMSKSAPSAPSTRRAAGAATTKSEEPDRSSSDEETPFGPPARPVVDEHDNYLLSDEETRSMRSQSKLSTISATGHRRATSESEEVVGILEIV